MNSVNLGIRRDIEIKQTQERVFIHDFQAVLFHEKLLLGLWKLWYFELKISFFYYISGLPDRENNIFKKIYTILEAS
jgi:ssDNA-specific exonuclease RecJ